MWILKLSGLREINMILREFSLNVDKETLLRIYDYATKNKFYPLMCDLDAQAENRFRKGIFETIHIPDFMNEGAEI